MRGGAGGRRQPAKHLSREKGCHTRLRDSTANFGVGIHRESALLRYCHSPMLPSWSTETKGNLSYPSILGPSILRPSILECYSSMASQHHSQPQVNTTPMIDTYSLVGSATPLVQTMLRSSSDIRSPGAQKTPKVRSNQDFYYSPGCCFTSWQTNSRVEGNDAMDGGDRLAFAVITVSLHLHCAPPPLPLLAAPILKSPRPRLYNPDRLLWQGFDATASRRHLTWRRG